MKPSLLLSAAFLAATVTSSFAASVLVADESGHSISLLDSDRGPVSRAPLDIAPHNVDVTADGRFALAVGIPPGDHASHTQIPGGMGRLVVLARNEGGLTMAAAFDIGGHPAHVVPDAQGRFAYVTDAESNSVVVADLAAKTVLARIGTGKYPHGLRLSPDGTKLAVANMKSGTVSLIDVKERSKLADVEVGRTPVQVAFDPDGKRLFVSLNGENKVATVDLATRSVVRTSPVGHGPVQLAVTSDHKVVVANQGSAKDPDNRVSVLNGETGASLATIEVGRGAHGVALDRVHGRAFVTNTFEDTMSVIDLGTLKAVAKYATGKGPNGVATD